MIVCIKDHLREWNKEDKGGNIAVHRIVVDSNLFQFFNPFVYLTLPSLYIIDSFKILVNPFTSNIPLH